MKRVAVLLLAASMLVGMAGCGDDSHWAGDLGGGAAPLSGVTGNAVKGPISGAEIRVFCFDTDGMEVEIVAQNAPVITGPDGAYSLSIEPSQLVDVTSPLIVTTLGGTMGDPPARAPTLEAVIPDPTLLTYEGYTVSCHLSTASSVAAGLLRKQAQETGEPPTPEDASFVIATVEDELWVDITQDPTDPTLGMAMVNECVDQNLNLIEAPDHHGAVNEYIDYLVANLASRSGFLDEKMDDPDNPGTDIPADFEPFGAGELADLVPGGPSGFASLMFSTDKSFIENNGMDYATLAATLTDGCGRPVSDVSAIDVRIVSGSCTTEDIIPFPEAGEVQLSITSLTVGEIVAEASYELPNGNTITQELLVLVVDMITDTDGDGISDGEETVGWEILIDELGHGDARLLTRRWVTGDPENEDTDRDGLDDYTEYLIRSDPRSADTDGDGFTDYEEWKRWQTSPASVDTDGDARGPDHTLAPNALLFDRNEIRWVGTSPTLDDTDGDARTDYEEIDHPVRSPLVAELPRLSVKITDEVDVRLDVEFAEEQGQTRQYGTELRTSQTETRSHYTSHSVRWSLMVGVESSAGLFSGIGGKYKTEFTFGTEHTYAFTAESSKTSEQAYSEYTTDSRTRTETAASGSMSMGIQLENPGNITYTITHLGFTVRQWQPDADPADPTRPGSFKTFATLTPALGGGITLAPGAITPVLQVEATDINASRVKEFLAAPASLYIEPAFYELENAEGLNFAFLEEVTANRTARMTIDFGQGDAEEYRVATNVARRMDGSYAGVTLGEVMTEILAIPFETRPRQELDPEALTNERVLCAVRNTENFEGTDEDPARGFWMVVIGGETLQAEDVDFEDVILQAGDQVVLLFVRDDDGDGLFAPEEQHYRTDDTGDDQDGDGLTDVEEVRGEVFVDEDGTEVRCGWVVEVTGRDPYPVFADPAVADQDEDGWKDSEEKAAGTDPTLPDTDRDGLADKVDPFPLVPARVIYVKSGAGGAGDGSSWEDAFVNLQAAIDDAAARNADEDDENDVAEVWVAEGTYTPGAVGELDRSFRLLNNVGIYGGFLGTEVKLSQRNANPIINNTILSGDLAGDDGPDFTGYEENSLHVVVVETPPETPETPIDETAVLDGFMITGGNANTAYGGGMVIDNASPTLRNLFFRANQATGGGGALYVVDGGGTSLTGCIFSRNRATNGSGGGMHTQRSPSRMEDTPETLSFCEFSENEAFVNGAGLYASGGTVTDKSKRTLVIDGCLFNLNKTTNVGSTSYGAGVCLVNGSHQITNSQFRSNTFPSEGEWMYFGAGGGIFATGAAKVVITQSVFWNNAANGIASDGSCDIRVINATFSLNRSWLPFGVALYTWESARASVENAVFWGNQTVPGWDPNPLDHTQIYGNVTVRNSCIQNLHHWFGNGNIGGDPKYVNEESGNLRLGSDSACIDRGANLVDWDPFEPGFQTLPEGDLDGMHRVVDGDGDGLAIVDMGAYEYQGE
jgi:predicted outer membrane repeat protein